VPVDRAADAAVQAEQEARQVSPVEALAVEAVARVVVEEAEAVVVDRADARADPTVPRHSGTARDVDADRSGRPAWFTTSPTRR
jgi:hypothetical protein